MARAAGGQFLLRIEDIDRQRSKPEWEDQLKDDLTWLGIRWDDEPMRQSDRMAAYTTALDVLWDMGLLYPCTCTRRDIQQALSAPQEGVEPIVGPDGPVYPGTCRPVGSAVNVSGPRPDAHLRLNMAAVSAKLSRSVQDRGQQWEMSFKETGPMHAGTIVTRQADYLRQIGDIVLARRDFGTSYHLSVVLDDAAQGVTHVVRGADLFEATAIHVLLQRLLGLPMPVYHHHDLVRNAAGKRLAKRDDARSVASYRDAGWTAEALRDHLTTSLTAPEGAFSS